MSLIELSHWVDSQDEGLPIRRVALSRLRMSYGQFKRAKFEGEVLLNGRIAHANEHVITGQRLIIRVPENVPLPVAPYALPLSIPYLDSDFLAVDKPAPLPSVPSSLRTTMTLENALFSHLGNPSGFVYRPINRLDKGTSGLMLVALTAHAQQRLQAMLHTELFVREYLAICDGCPPEREGTIDLPIAKAEGATIRREVCAEGKSAVTHYQRLQTTKDRSLVRLRLETGRTHQIRVHMQALGCPITGDFLYGKEHPLLEGRFALHSHRIVLRHPFTDHPMVLESPLPRALSDLLTDS